jgi:ornithine cyclodeaminase
VTSSAEPVVLGEWLKPGAHVNAVGACLPTMRELDGAAMARATLFVDRRESCENEAGDYLLAVEEGAIEAGHIRAELGEVLAGEAPGRTSEEEITVFESLGLAIEDLAAAEYIERRAQESGSGATVEF